jgi:hypothetical protein
MEGVKDALIMKRDRHSVSNTKEWYGSFAIQETFLHGKQVVQAALTWASAAHDPV